MCLSKNPIYAKSEDFDFVENFIRSHCANDGGVEPEIDLALDGQFDRLA